MPGKRKQQRVHQLDLAPVVFEQRRQAPANAEVDAHAAVVRVDAIHIVALFVGHHFERELVVIAQEQRPLAIGRDGRRFLQDLHHRKAILHANGHEQARHQREMKGHVAFGAVGEIGDRVLGPLIGFGQQDAVLVFRIDVLAKLLQERVRFGQVFAVGAFPLVQIGHRVQAESVHAQVEPKVDHVQDRLLHLRIVEVEIGLMRVEAMPVIRFGDRIPGPVGGFEILEDDARVLIFLRRVAPDVEVAPACSGRGAARALEPGMLVGGVVQHHFGEDANAAAVRLFQEVLEIAQRPVGGMDVSCSRRCRNHRRARVTEKTAAARWR